MAHLMNEEFLRIADALAERAIFLEKLELTMDFDMGPRALGQLPTIGMITTRFEMHLQTERPDAIRELVEKWPFGDGGFHLDQVDLPTEMNVAHELNGTAIALTHYTITLKGHILE